MQLFGARDSRGSVGHRAPPVDADFRHTADSCGGHADIEIPAARSGAAPILRQAVADGAIVIGRGAKSLPGQAPIGFARKARRRSSAILRAMPA